ncbi:glycosyl hydrolase family 28 protein [Pedobacter sp. MR2016-24]|uniref:glycosyl hydrolase family 28 protein n=1 Tax=Pedobacter sp. MR2016-24 TaxID=2994466 RepID=UPI0022486C89|nr:glycosyl hydrolase family 28 protein [Pedobacter sp. MR2016-24]MCX2486207.1 glycosyl hydrolase family 28 protein [Pedobacter sp. MR2016-24]
MKRRLLVILTLCFTAFSGFAWKAESEVIIYPAPAGETLSRAYQVTAAGKNVPVYVAKVASSDRKLRYKAMDDKINSARYFEEAAFSYFDLPGSATITVSAASVIKTVKILPSSYQIAAEIKAGKVIFQIKAGQQVTVEINGEIIQSLHIFANTIEKNKPDANDPDVLFYGPGIHEISRLVVKDNQTLYLAGGAILRTVIGENEKASTTPTSGLKNKPYPPSISLTGKNIKVRGRGIIDASACPTHSRNMIMVQGENISIEGIILRDAPLWTLPVRQSAGIHIDNIKLLGYRANSDGVDICNSSNVLVENCFIRTLDDLVVIKSLKGKGDTRKITVRKCVLWNEVAHALSLGAEINENIHDVLFTDCDVIHDQAREWSLRVYHCDGGLVSNIRFENLRIEESKKFISLWINKDVWTTDEHRGHIDNISFKNIMVKGTPLTVELLGYGPENLVNKVSFKNITLNGEKLKAAQVKTNEFVKQVNFK